GFGNRRRRHPRGVAGLFRDPGARRDGGRAPDPGQEGPRRHHHPLRAALSPQFAGAGPGWGRVGGSTGGGLGRSGISGARGNSGVGTSMSTSTSVGFGVSRRPFDSVNTAMTISTMIRPPTRKA